MKLYARGALDMLVAGIAVWCAGMAIAHYAGIDEESSQTIAFVAAALGAFVAGFTFMISEMTNDR